MTLKTAVDQTPEIKGAWKPGLRALRRGDSKRVEAADTRRLAGSVDLDTTLRDRYPNDSRWDYAVGFRVQSGTDYVYWIEVHPANEGAVRELLNKLVWLRNWIRKGAPALNRLQKEFVWIASGKTSFTQGSPQAKRLAAAGIRQVGRRLKLDG